MTGSKSTQTRFVGITYHIHYTSLRLLFFIIMHLLMSMYLSSEVCGSLTDIQVIPSCHDGGMVSLIQSHAYILLAIFASLNLKASVGMYSRCDYPLQLESCLCIFLSCHPYFILQFYLIVFYLCIIKLPVPPDVVTSTVILKLVLLAVTK